MKPPKRPWRKFHRQIQKKSARKLNARGQKRYGLWYGLGLIGILGWSVMIPLLLGLALGFWLDGVFDNDFPWSLLMLIVGLILGCINAWYWVVKETSE
ncbi:MAG: AtpZ/AtpI family protein [Spirulinaceae cyanobacterium]